MGGKKDSGEQRAAEERARAEAAGARQAAGAERIGARLPEEETALTGGISRLEEVTGLALQPQEFISRLQPQVEALTRGAGREIFEELAPQFARRGLSTSGLFPAAGSRALVQQALGISRMILGAAPQFLGLGLGGAQALTGVGTEARRAQQQAGLTGLGLETQLMGGGLQRGFQAQESAALRELQRQQTFGQAVGGVLGLGGQLGAAALTKPATTTFNFPGQTF